MNRLHLPLALLAIALPVSAMAERLRVDVLVFLNPPSAEERGTAARHPDDARAIAIDDVRGLALAGIALLPEAASTLAPEWALLGSRRAYKPLLRLSWVQENTITPAAIPLRIYLPGGDGISGLGGWVALQGGHHPALSADLEYLEPGADRQPLGLRLQEKRSLAPGALHYLDSPRIGLLARITAAR